MSGTGLHDRPSAARSPLLQQILCGGLNAAVDQIDGWVLSTGVDAGSNRLFGTGLRAAGLLAPCIGVTAWQAVSDDLREKIAYSLRRKEDHTIKVSRRSEDAKRRGRNLECFSPRDSNHSHTTREPT